MESNGGKKTVGQTILEILKGPGYTLFLCAAFLCCGTLNTLCFKMMNECVSKGTGTFPPRNFMHPLSQTSVMFFAMALVLVAHFIILGINRCRRKKPEAFTTQVLDPDDKPKKPAINSLLLAFPGCCDLTATTLLNVGLINTYASVYQMLNTVITVFTAIMAVLILKRRLFPHQILGIVFISIGSVLVALSSIVSNKTREKPARDPILGAIAVLCGQAVFSLQFIFEEAVLSNYALSPQQCVGWEGFWGGTVNLIVAFIAFQIPGNAAIDDYGRLENYPVAIVNVVNDPIMWGIIVGAIISIALFNFFGISITKRAGSTTRCTIDCLRTISVWSVQLIRKVDKFEFMQFAGFLMLVCGSFTYNRVIRLFAYDGWYTNVAKADGFDHYKGICKWACEKIRGSPLPNTSRHSKLDYETIKVTDDGPAIDATASVNKEVED